MKKVFREKEKKNNVIIKIVISFLQILTFMNVYSHFIVGENIDDFISLLLMVVELVVLLNLYNLLDSRYFVFDFSLLSLMLLIRLNILNSFVRFDAEYSIGIIVVIVSLISRIYFVGKTDYCEKYKQEKVSNQLRTEMDIREYVYNRILCIFKMGMRKDAYEEERKYLWISLSGFLAIVMFVGKLIIDVKNIFLSVYTYGKVCIDIYIILSILFIIINVIKAKNEECSIMIEIFCVLCFLVGVNLFVFAQRENARFQILVLTAYLCSPYVMHMRDLVHKYGF